MSSAVMFKIKRMAGDLKTIVALIGHIGAASLPELKAQIETAGHDVALDMAEVTLVDVDVVRFLIECRARGIELRGCSAYIREWIVREQEGQA
jgi:anti-anti-sigma regulatory factor